MVYVRSDASSLRSDESLPPAEADADDLLDSRIRLWRHHVSTWVPRGPSGPQASILRTDGPFYHPVSTPYNLTLDDNPQVFNYESSSLGDLIGVGPEGNDHLDPEWTGPVRHRPRPIVSMTTRYHYREDGSTYLRTLYCVEDPAPHHAALGVPLHRTGEVVPTWCTMYDTFYHSLVYTRDEGNAFRTIRQAHPAPQ